MLPSNSTTSVDGTTPSLDAAAPGGDDRKNESETTTSGSRKRIWWKKILDSKEAKDQILFSLPMILVNVCFYAIPLVSVMFAGHLGKLELAGATFATSWANVTGFSFMTGLSGALETLCGQAFGAGRYRMLGIYLQASCILSFFFSILVSVIWFFTEPILILLHQDPSIAKQSALYMKYLIPGIFAYGFLQNILRFLQTQSVVRPLIFFSLVPMGIHFGIVYVLVYRTSLGFIGAPLAASISLWIAVLLLGMYVTWEKKLRQTWEGFSFESISFVIPNVGLSFYSAAIVCLEYWAFELLVVFAGLMPDAEITTSVIAMCVNTEAIAFMTTYGLSAAASTRVSNELGAGNIKRANEASAVSLKLSAILGIAIVVVLAFGHNIWAGFFTNNPEIIKEFAAMTPFLLISLPIDSVQGVLSGVVRGCGWQRLTVLVNLGTFILLGMPIAALVGFKLELYAKGLWIGLICGLFSQASTLLLITICKSWSKLEIPLSRGSN